MQQVYTIPSGRNALSESGILRVYFYAFSSKNRYGTTFTSDYDQGCFIVFECCSFTGKERDEETGYGYFGARYMDYELMTMWLSVDPMADKYPSISPYAYCAWNPMKLVDPDGREFGDYYNKKGKYLGWDGNNDNNVYIICNRADIKRIKNNDKKGRTTSVDDLQSKPLLKTTYGVLREACNVLDRAEKNSGQTKEECSVVEYKSGLGVRSSTGESQSVYLPQIPDWLIDAVSIHSHNKYNDATQMSGHQDDHSGDADHFGNFVQNVIVGPLGVGGASGLCFYPRTSDKTNPVYKMRKSVADKIIGQQSIRIQREIKRLIQNL